MHAHMRRCWNLQKLLETALVEEDTTDNAEDDKEVELEEGAIDELEADREDVLDNCTGAELEEVVSYASAGPRFAGYAVLPQTPEGVEGVGVGVGAKELLGVGVVVTNILEDDDAMLELKLGVADTLEDDDEEEEGDDGDDDDEDAMLELRLVDEAVDSETEEEEVVMAEEVEEEVFEADAVEDETFEVDENRDDDEDTARQSPNPG
ncbi:hypothetical protein BKA66DRAFT_445214 [Pyrenochaeta sp. MPI-SDFR-AT-0127]|nr:hypothetical protein BKA66DRAFT_445214 [Pyrenochaeta sp. MPI-SDFR-AT-0127]